MTFSFHGEIILFDRTVLDAYVVCQAGSIIDVSTERPAGAPVIEGRYISPGFVDLHVHGGGGADYMDGSPDAVRIANRVHARHGTTTIFPTTTSSNEEIRAMLDACGAVAHYWPPKDGARIGGVHYYGPYFAEDKVGCHSKKGRRDPDRAEYEGFLSTGLIRIATCAAELPGADEFYRAARRHGCLLTCGQTFCRSRSL